MLNWIDATNKLPERFQGYGFTLWWHIKNGEEFFKLYEGIPTKAEINQDIPTELCGAPELGNILMWLGGYHYARKQV